MIIALAAKVREQVANFTNLQTSASQVDTIQATSEELTKLRGILQGWVSIYPLLVGLLDDVQNGDVRGRAAFIQQRLQESRNTFSSDFNQRITLTSLSSKSQQLVEATRGYWKLYADGKLSALRERAHVARQLPRMQANIADIEGAVAQLENLSKKLPEKKSEIDAFHDKLTQLDGALRNMKGVDAEQTAFLRKLDSGTATLADISPELLNWCKSEGLALSLKIQLGR